MKTFRQISLLLLLFLLAVSSTAFAADWQRIGANDKCAHFFDRDSIRYERFYPPFFGNSRPDTSRITYWEKITIAPEEAEAMAEELDDRSALPPLGLRPSPGDRFPARQNHHHP